MFPFCRPIDDNSAVSNKNDCEIFLCPIERGAILKEVDVADLDKIAPLMYKLELPVDVLIPDSVSPSERRRFAQDVFFKIRNEVDDRIWSECRKAKEESAYFFASLIDIFGTIAFQFSPNAKISWRLFGFQCHSEFDYVCGVDNLVYTNVSKKIDCLAKSGDLAQSETLQLQ
jgi:hypothetical protein